MKYNDKGQFNIPLTHTQLCDVIYYLDWKIQEINDAGCDLEFPEIEDTLKQLQDYKHQLSISYNLFEVDRLKWLHIEVYVMGRKLVRAKKLYYLILDDESKYCLLKLDVASKDYVELDHDLDLFALSRLLFQQDNDSYHKIPNKKE